MIFEQQKAFLEARIKSVSGLIGRFSLQSLKDNLIRVAELSSEEELEAYQAAFQSLSGNHVDLDYLRCSSVYGVFRGDIMEGGFVLKIGPELRYANMFLGREEKLDIIPASLDDVIEITCVFMTSRSPAVHLFGALKMADLVARSGCSQVMAGTRIEGVSKAHAKLFGNAFYQGPVVTAKGEQYWWFYHGEVEYFRRMIRRKVVDKLMNPPKKAPSRPGIATQRPQVS